MPASIDITGIRYGKLVAIRRMPKIGSHTRWLFVCDCGSSKEIRLSHVIAGSIKSCGCIVKTRDGWSTTRIMRVWRGMHKRCTDPKDHRYSRYGGRGISVCEEWSSFDVFKDWAFANGFDESLEIDRKDNSSGYSPENCRFVSHVENTRNRDISRTIQINGNNIHINEAASQYGLTPSALISRIARGDDVERAIRPPRYNVFFGERLSLGAAEKKFGISQYTIAYRIRKGMTPDQAVSNPPQKGRIKDWAQQP
ncbi:hypothetical protein K7W03_14525 [Sphingobium sp. PNB]|uniref:hypothetical protein n=1 Tax=Sphingobium sp. PNB TaxID=863934 RepID=UPI001CA46CB4|nr:hypothetical protein [Sphingobium sp. PNB]MCB4860807.1 hypothetical protein [Sphingobium sp. PNB]